MNPTRNGFPLFQFPNILSPALAGKFLLLLFLFLIVCFLIIRQYHILENQIKLTAFFKHAAEILPLGNDEALPVGMRQIPVELKHIRGDAREEIHRHLPWVAEKLYQDPFPASEAASYLPIYFGYTKHPVPLESELIDPSQPAWFTERRTFAIPLKSKFNPPQMTFHPYFSLSCLSPQQWHYQLRLFIP